MPVAMYQAFVLSRDNRREHERLGRRRKKLERHVVQENTAQEEARRAVYEQVLVPFCEDLRRLRGVDLAELAPVDSAAHTTVDVELRETWQLAAAAVGSVAGGAVAGAGVGAAAYLAVGTFATASTGTAISSLSGAAASSATLAWLGGGSLAAGGGGVAAGTTVLATAFIAAPALLVTGALLEWLGRGVREDQRKLADRLREAEAELTGARRTLSEVFQRSREIRLVLGDLGAALRERLPALTALVHGCDDYAAYGPGQRAQVKEAFDLACMTVAVMKVPPAGEDGRVHERSARMVAEARAHLAALGTAA
ncbi:hypothetical protein EDD96_1421 [Streptomyces sp. Ag109_G2-6]|uniref:hypothetical protein n=1 Tax=Streptomyces TaxID=1883 RepID=UPI0009A4FDCE|nr:MULTISPECIES: hypothetical protein [Streptomyces]RPF44878.1 hypothetical protein EDD96_1421 [Streptomyces sp. Ag109_G2-6]